MKCQTQTVVVVIVNLHHQRQGHVASIIVLLSDSGSGCSHPALSEARPCSLYYSVNIRQW